MEGVKGGVLGQGGGRRPDPGLWGPVQGWGVDPMTHSGIAFDSSADVLCLRSNDALH